MVYQLVFDLSALIIYISILNFTNGNKSVNLEGKIVGGQVARLEQFPFSVQFFNLGSLCAGTIINSWTVMTSAHCIDFNKDTDDMMIQIGSRFVYDFTAKLFNVMSYVIHENYNRSAQFGCDIALIFVDRPIEFNNKTQKSILVNHDKWMDGNETKFKVTGWGLTSYGGEISDLGLLMASLRFIPSKECSRLHRMTLAPDMFCLYGDGVRDTCKGDSGGGVLWNGMIVGITSHGNGCANKGKPSVYANVWYFRKWIRDQVYTFFNEFCYVYHKSGYTPKKKKLLGKTNVLKNISIH